MRKKRTIVPLGFGEASKYKDIIYKISTEYEIPPSIIAGIGSRESGWGLRLRPPGPSGTGDFVERSFPRGLRKGPLPPDGLGFGRGLMQIDFDYHQFARKGNWQDPAENISYGVSLLKKYIKYLSRYSDSRRAGIAAYNAGPGMVSRAIKKGIDPDYYTSGGDYSIDILKRAEFFKSRGWV